jgi:dolichol kinase
VRDGALRPLVHAALLGFAFLAPVIGGLGMAGVALAALGFNAFVLPRTALGRSLARPGEPRWNGLLSYPLAVALLFVLFPLEAAVAGWAVLALGDPAAALAGSGPRLPWNRAKSVGGTFGFLTAAAPGALLVTACVFPVLMGLPRGRLLEDGDALLLYAGWIAAGAVAGALAETLDLGIDDNLPVALAAGGALALLSP